MQVMELAGLTAWIEGNLAKIEQERAKGAATAASAEWDDPRAVASLVTTINEHLQGAREAAEEDHPTRKDAWNLRRWLRSSSSGSSFERAQGNIDAAEAHILRLAPSEYLRGHIPSLRAHVNRYLKKDDPRRQSLAGLDDKHPLDQGMRTALVAAYHAANSQRRREFLRLRSFRNVLFIAAGLMVVVAVGLGILGSVRPQMLPLCFHVRDQAKVVCPTQETAIDEPAGGAGNQQASEARDIDQAINETVSAWDIWLVEIVGLVAAALASAFSLRGMRGTALPYSLPIGLAVLKLPTGAVTAVLGILLMRGGFVPGLSALDTPAQILSWAIVFGYAQQLFTRFVDQQGMAVIENVRGRGPAGDREPEPATAV